MSKRGKEAVRDIVQRKNSARGEPSENRSGNSLDKIVMLYSTCNKPSEAAVILIKLAFCLIKLFFSPDAF